MVPPGKFDGTLEIGDGTVGMGKGAITLRHQEPLVLNNLSGIELAVWVVISAGIRSLPFGYRKPPGEGFAAIRTSDVQDYTAPLAVVAVGLTLYPFVAWVAQSKDVPAMVAPVAGRGRARGRHRRRGDGHERAAPADPGRRRREPEVTGR